MRFCIDMFHQQLHHSPLVRGLKVPNAATAQLLNWHKRRTGGERASVMYRIAPQCTSAPMYLVPKAVPAPSLDALDSRGAFVVQTADQTIIWQVNAPGILDGNFCWAGAPHPQAYIGWHASAPA